LQPVSDIKFKVTETDIVKEPDKVKRYRFPAQLTR